MENLEPDVVETTTDPKPDAAPAQGKPKPNKEAPLKYTDADVDNIVKNKHTRWKKKMDNEIQTAVADATKELTESIQALRGELEAEKLAKSKLAEEAVLNKKVDAVRAKLTGANAVDANLLLPHINFENVTIDEAGNVDTTNVVETLQIKFPAAFGTVKPGSGGTPPAGNHVEPMTEVQRANQAIAEGHNRSAIARLIKAGKI